ncbi:hypothetical protein [Naasia aerilata]|uniref:Alpha/beta hydrolase n=1 Tax=Naasia aerilata TaxID=1162966 RepID=A0ABM8GE15_9MICO|nr:hypothetical protein [Naasia aerilata]BDZ46545.1 hypothetical protein GCM10025866_24540 [Naasia aerilata]
MGPYVPQLLFPTFAAIRRGAQSEPIEWAAPETIEGLSPTQVAEWVAARVEPALTSADPRSTIVIGKSLGSYAAFATARLMMPAIWVTPLLTERVVLEALEQSAAPFLLVGGTDDPLWNGETARSLTPHVLEIPGGDHGLFVPGPLALSAMNMAELARASEGFLDDVVWPP